MRRFAFVVLMAAGVAGAQERVVTLKEVVDLAAKQNPEVAMMRLNERKAAEAVRAARDPFYPKVAAGSGLAYSSGIPMSIEGSTPSIIQAQASQFLFNRQQTNLVAQARENARGATIETAAKRDEVVLRAALTYLDAERAARAADTVRKQVASLERIGQAVALRVEGGRELPIESKRAALNLARARQRVQSLEADREYAEELLAALIGAKPGERIRVAAEDRAAAALPRTEEACAEAAVGASAEVRRIESAITAKGFEIRAQKAAKLPRVDLVAQYALLGRFNNYEDFFRKFQRHNGQLGVSFQIPLSTGPGVAAQVAQAETEAARLRLELESARSRAAIRARRQYQQVKQAETARDVARLDLDVAREQLSVLLAQLEEGKVSLRQVEEARVAEDDKWLAFLESSYTLEAARLELLGQTGDLVAGVR
ncbi:MAG TPA: TolC family protein [Bryobacteraceae bacterium]|nr:TolC family protein [Bryobacteraceae bacterium]